MSISKEVKEKKKEILYESNPKYIGGIYGTELPHSQGKRQRFTVHDYNKFGIALTISGIRGRPYAEMFIERKEWETLIENLNIPHPATREDQKAPNPILSREQR